MRGDWDWAGIIGSQPGLMVRRLLATHQEERVHGPVGCALLGSKPHCIVGVVVRSGCSLNGRLQQVTRGRRIATLAGPHEGRLTTLYMLVS